MQNRISHWVSAGNSGEGSGSGDDDQGLWRQFSRTMHMK